MRLEIQCKVKDFEKIQCICKTKIQICAKQIMRQTVSTKVLSLVLSVSMVCCFGEYIQNITLPVHFGVIFLTFHLPYLQFLSQLFTYVTVSNHFDTRSSSK